MSWLAIKLQIVNSLVVPLSILLTPIVALWLFFRPRKTWLELRNRGFIKATKRELFSLIDFEGGHHWMVDAGYRVYLEEPKARLYRISGREMVDDESEFQILVKIKKRRPEEYIEHEERAEIVSGPKFYLFDLINSGYLLDEYDGGCWLLTQSKSKFKMDTGLFERAHQELIMRFSMMQDFLKIALAAHNNLQERNRPTQSLRSG